MRSAENPEALLGPDLWALAISVGGPPIEALELTTLPSARSERASFRLVFGDGSVRKGRRMRDAAWAGRVNALRGLIPPRHLPSLLGVRGAAVLTEWCEGESPSPTDTEALRAAGVLVGSLHSIAVPADLVRAYGFPFHRWEERLERNLATLREWNALTGDQAARAHEMALATTPTNPRLGLVHCDFCPENLIVDHEGVLVMIDNENLTVDALPFDLARTWYRWPLGADTADVFWDGYRTECDPAPFLEHAPYWMIQVLTEAAAFRVTGGTSDQDVPLMALERVLSGTCTADGPAA